jgi:hypothetical protein
MSDCHDDQLDLIFSPLTEPDERGGTPGERFAAFHQANPHVLVSLIRLCLDVFKRGRKGWSINGAFEVLRWSSLRTTGDDFRLNNDYRAFYARLIPLVEPRLEGFFEVRVQRNECDLTWLSDDIARIGGWSALVTERV